MSEAATLPTQKPTVVKQDFVPDENFCWELDLESTNKKKGKKNNNQVNSNMPVVIKSEPVVAVMETNVKLKIRDNIEFSMTHIDKVNKGLINTTNCCYMNVCLQSLLSSPPFFNMLLAIDENTEISQ